MKKLLETLTIVVMLGAVINLIFVPAPAAGYFGVVYVAVLAGLFVARLKVGQK